MKGIQPEFERLRLLGLKRCNGPCGLVKPHEDFVRNGTAGRDGRVGKCRSCQNEARADWRAKNPDKLYEMAQRDYAKHTEKRKANAMLGVHRRRARILGAFIEDIDRNVVFRMHGGMCGICKEFINGEFEVDHVIPLARGGRHGYINVQPSHIPCNRTKGDRIV